MKNRTGMVLIFSLVAIAVIVTMSAAYAAATGLNVRQSDNFRHAMDAQMAAESGLAFLTSEMRNSGVSGSLRGQTLLDSLAGKLGANLNGTPNLGNSKVSYDGTTIVIPRISIGDGRTFTARINLPAADTLRLSVTGQSASGSGASATSIHRGVALDFHPTWDEAIGFGLCSKGPVVLGMNTDLLGISDPADGSIYSAATGVAVEVGSGHITGSVSVSDPSASMSLSKATVDGSINEDVPPVTMPVIDRSSYKSHAVNVIDSTTDLSSGKFKNILIKANTNPVFGSVSIQGVMYIESPNIIQFTNNVEFAGVMVADDPATGSPDSANRISFVNNMTFNGSEDLPDTPDFQDVKKYAGASVLCPGFTMEFKNNMTSVAGIIALKALVAKNNVSSTVKGSMLIYGAAGLDFKNNTDLSISMSGSSPPPGFTGHGLLPLEADPESYTETCTPVAAE